MAPPCKFKTTTSSNCLNLVTFKINGKNYIVRSGEVPVDTSLNSYIRNYAQLSGTKFMCREGGCGACVVTLTSIHPVTKKEITYAVNSCLLKVWSCHQADVTTIEGAKDFHYNDSKYSISDQLANMNGSQCGYCSPGMVMNMYGLIKSKGQPTEQDVEDGYSGHMCRCTGYKPILEAFRQLVAPRSDCAAFETDIEDIGCAKKCARMKAISSGDEEDLETCFVEYALAQPSLKLDFGNGTCWYKASTIKEIMELFDMINGTYMLINGNTAKGVSPKAFRDVTIDNYIDIREVAELRTTSISSSGIEIGANITLSEFIDVLQEASTDKNFSNLFQYALELKEHILLVANVAVRNTGTVAGNLSIKYKLLKEFNNTMFQSDIWLLLDVVGAILTIKEQSGTDRQYNMTDYLTLESMNKKLITKIQIPPLDQSIYKISTYKIMPRAQNAPANLNAGFLFKFKKDSSIIEKAVIVYGGINATFTHAEKTELYLTGKDISDEKALKEAIDTLKKDIVDVPDLPPAYIPEYRKQLAFNLYYKAVLNINKQLNKNVLPKYVSGSKKIEQSRNLSSGKTEINVPVEGARGRKIPKLEAYIQCRGEAEYVNDIPIIRDQLYAAMVVTPAGPGLITSVDTSKAKAMPGFVKYITHTDIPGENSLFSISIVTLEAEKLFCGDTVSYAGQPCGVIVATSQEEADAAARAVVIEVKQIEKPLTTIDDVLKKWPVYPNLRVLPSPYIPFLNDKRKRNELIKNTLLHLKNQMKGTDTELGETEIGEEIKELQLKEEDVANMHSEETVNKNLKDDNLLDLKIVEGEFEMGAQYHYTMELQSCTVVPIENGQLEVYSSAQWPHVVQNAISKVLGIMENKVNVYVRRVGGAYGSKITRCAYAASACALAAYILERPVRMVMDLQSNMKSMGKRCPMKCRYNVLVEKSTGKIQSFNKLEVFNDKGVTLNDPVFIYVPGGLVNCYDVYSKAILLGQMRLYSVKTDTPSSAWCRAPGSLEGFAVIENIMAKISANLPNLDPVEIRKNNMSAEKDKKFIEFYMDKANNKINYKAEVESVKKFNSENRWRKQGFALVPMKFPIEYFYQFYCTVSINADDGTISIVHGGCEIGQGVNTKAAVAAAYIFGLPDTTRISVKPTCIYLSPNNSPSGGSMTSDAITYACMRACLIIKEKMDFIKTHRSLPVDMNWLDLVKAVLTFGCNLNATYMWQLGQDGHPVTGALEGYTVDAVGAAKVEVDVLTGQHIVRHVWIYEDTGSSFAPLIDMGQVQGAFIMGLGYFTTEELHYSPETGQLLTDRTWNYDVPGAKDIPEIFDVVIENDSELGAKPNPVTGQVHDPPYGVMGAKATGEPPLLLSITVLFAIKEAIRAARRDAGILEVDFDLNAPATNASKLLISHGDDSYFKISS